MDNNEQSRDFEQELPVRAFLWEYAGVVAIHAIGKEGDERGAQYPSFLKARSASSPPTTARKHRQANLYNSVHPIVFEDMDAPRLRTSPDICSAPVFQ